MTNRDKREKAANLIHSLRSMLRASADDQNCSYPKAREALETLDNVLPWAYPDPPEPHWEVGCRVRVASEPTWPTSTVIAVGGGRFVADTGCAGRCDNYTVIDPAELEDGDTVEVRIDDESPWIGYVSGTIGRYPAVRIASPTEPHEPQMAVTYHSRPYVRVIEKAKRRVK